MPRKNEERLEDYPLPFEKKKKAEKPTRVTKSGHAQTGGIIADGSKEIPEKKAALRSKLHVSRTRFDVYNETKKKFVNY